LGLKENPTLPSGMFELVVALMCIQIVNTTVWACLIHHHVPHGTIGLK